MASLAVVAATFACVSAQSPDYKALWEQFKSDYERPYLIGSSDESERFGVFKSNVDIITAENAKGLSYQLGINQFADLTSEEFAQTYARGVKAKTVWGDLPKVPFPNMSEEVLSDSVDWVAKGAVTPVKNQGQCGSCWAFSTTGSVEGAYQRASGKLVSLSEENLVQCDHDGDQGCNGGLMDNAFGWIKHNGICAEADYPYTSGSGTQGTCTKGCKPVVTVTGFTDVPSNDENALKRAVANGPVSIALEADKLPFQLYRGGILDNSACGTQLDHGVLIVGYGNDGKDYWKVKNSWGATWGEQGYIRIVRGKNMCGLAAQPSYPTGAKAAGPSPGPGPSPPSPSPPGGNCFYSKSKGDCLAKATAGCHWCKIFVVGMCLPEHLGCPEEAAFAPHAKSVDELVV